MLYRLSGECCGATIRVERLPRTRCWKP